MSQRFSPLFLSNIIIRPLRYFFSYYSGSDLKYDSDEKISQIEIGSYNDFNKVPLQVKPRILVNRGAYSIRPSGLSDNMAESPPIGTTKGITDSINLIFIDGMATITIEAIQEGTVELITDMVTHFLVWSKPFICNTAGFKAFAMPISVSPPIVTKEDREIFRTDISIPYTMEEDWRTRNDALKLNKFYQTLIIV